MTPTPPLTPRSSASAGRSLWSSACKDLTLQLNSIGDPACRPAYVQALKSYYGEHVESLCRDCTARLDRAPLRLLDCKNAPVPALH